MTVAATPTETTYALAGAALGPFATVWPYAQDADVAPILHLNGADLALSPGDYTLAPLGADPLVGGGQVTLSAWLLTGSAWPDGSTLTLARSSDNDQPSVFGEIDYLSPADLMAALDHVERQVQELRTRASRAVSMSYGEAGYQFPPPPERLGKLFGFDDVTGAPELTDGLAFKGDPGGNAMAIGLFTGLGAMTIPVGTDVIRTTGHHVAGVGGCYYARTATAVLKPWRAHDSSGAWFELIDEQMVTPQCFGAMGDGLTDDLAALHYASDWLNDAPQRHLTLNRQYRAGRGTGPYFTDNYMKEGVITIRNPSDTGLHWRAGGCILMDNLNPGSGNGDQCHGLVVLSLGKQSSGFRSTGTIRIKWRVRPTARSQGDGIRFYGFPADATLGGLGNGLVSDIDIEKSWVKWAPQVGAIVLGCSDVDWGSHTSIQTRADGFHSNANRKLEIRNVIGDGCGDDTCAFVTYYNANPEVMGAGTQPYSQGALGVFSNYACSVGQVTSLNGLANGLRFAGSYYVTAGRVTAIGGIHGVACDAGPAGGPNAWSIQQSMGCTITHLTVNGASDGLFVRSYNATPATDPDIYWRTDLVIDNLTTKACTATSINASVLAGLRLGRCELDGAYVAMVSIEDLHIAHLGLKNAPATHSTITGRTDGISFGIGFARPFTGLRIDAIDTYNAELQLQDITGYRIGQANSVQSPKNGFYLVRCSRGSWGPIQVDMCNRTNDGSQNNALACIFLPAARVLQPSHHPRRQFADQLERRRWHGRG